MHRFLRRGALVGAGAVLLAVPLAGPAAATAPAPQPGYAPGATTTPNVLELYYQRKDQGLSYKTLQGSTWSTSNLGGLITTGPAPISISALEFTDTWVFAAGGNGAVYYRRFSDGQGLWGPWTSFGGFTVGTPATSCTGGLGAQPVVWVVGGDGALWRRALSGGGWASLGGLLGSEPAAVPAVGGVCPPAEDVVALGNDLAVWERRAGGWTRIGGRSFVAPTIVRTGAGVSYLFVIGTNGSLYQATRPSDGAAWSGFTQVGGIWTSPPAAQIYPGAPATLSVQALGGNDQLYRATKTIGSPNPWVFAQVP